MPCFHFPQSSLLRFLSLLFCVALSCSNAGAEEMVRQSRIVVAMDTAHFETRGVAEWVDYLFSVDFAFQAGADDFCYLGKTKSETKTSRGLAPPPVHIAFLSDGSEHGLRFSAIQYEEMWDVFADFADEFEPYAVFKIPAHRRVVSTFYSTLETMPFSPDGEGRANDAFFALFTKGFSCSVLEESREQFGYAEIDFDTFAPKAVDESDLRFVISEVNSLEFDFALK